MVLEPVSVPKAARAAAALAAGDVDVITPNANELIAMAEALSAVNGRPALPRPAVRADGQEAGNPARVVQQLAPHAAAVLAAGEDSDGSYVPCM